MAKVIPRDPDANTSKSNSVSFKKDDESGLFKKITLETNYNHLDYTTKKEKPKISEYLYDIGNQENYDYKFDVTGPSGNIQTIYFKKTNSKIK